VNAWGVARGEPASRCSLRQMSKPKLSISLLKTTFNKAVEQLQETDDSTTCGSVNRAAIG
jgi:hypothetical protein